MKLQRLQQQWLNEGKQRRGARPCLVPEIDLWQQTETSRLEGLVDKAFVLHGGLAGTAVSQDCPNEIALK